MDAVTQALISSLSAQITAAEADLALSSATLAQQAAARQIVAHAQEAIALLTAEGTGTRTITVRPTVFGAESVFVIAQRELGDMLRYTDVLAANGLSDLVLSVGQTLNIPTT